MWAETIGYRDYRHPYLKRFFPSIAQAIPLAGSEDLLDLGCGAGEVALGFAPFVASLTGMDLERPMLEEAGKRAKAVGHAMRLVHAKVEEAPEGLGQFHFITMGRAHWFMHSPATLARLERWLAPGGRILVCMPVINPAGAEWHATFEKVRNRWVRGSLRELMRLRVDQFFAGSDFAEVRRIRVDGQKSLELEHLLYRALGTCSTTRAVLGPDTDKMLADLRAALTPYFRDGPIIERHATIGIIIGRRRES